jgi:hypothetical protein
LPPFSRYFFIASTSGAKKRSGHHEHGRIVGHRARLRDGDFLDGVVLASQRAGDGVVAVAFSRSRVLLAVPLGEVHLSLLARHHLDHRGGDVLLVVRGGALGASLVVEDERAGRRLIGLRDRRLLVGVDVLGADVLRDVLVLLQLVAVAREVEILGEHRDLKRRIELGQHAARLIGQAELLGGRQVPALVLARADVVDRDEDAEDDEHAGSRQGAVPRLAVRKDAYHLAPFAGGVGEDADEAGERHRLRVLAVVVQRRDKLQRERDRDQCRPEPAE